MAYPVDANRATTVFTSSSTFVCNLPSSIVAGDLLVLVARNANTRTTTLPTGWSWLVQDNQTDASDDTTDAIYRWADGTEGATVSLVFTGGNSKGASICWRITGAQNPSIIAPEVIIDIGTAANADPTTITPTGGSKSYLFLSALAYDGTTAPTNQPTGYSNLATAGPSTGGSATSNAGFSGASRQVTASSENPGAWTNAAPQNAWTALTIAIHPGNISKDISPPTTGNTNTAQPLSKTQIHYRTITRAIEANSARILTTNKSNIQYKTITRGIETSSARTLTTNKSNIQYKTLTTVVSPGNAQTLDHHKRYKITQSGFSEWWLVW